MDRSTPFLLSTEVQLSVSAAKDENLTAERIARQDVLHQSAQAGEPFADAGVTAQTRTEDHRRSRRQPLAREHRAFSLKERAVRFIFGVSQGAWPGLPGGKRRPVEAIDLPVGPVENSRVPRRTSP